MSKFVPPTIKLTAFSCPHCGAYTSQSWFNLHAKKIDGERPIPGIPDAEYREFIVTDPELPDEIKNNLLAYCDRMASGLVFLEDVRSEWTEYPVSNLHISQCYNCQKAAVWVHELLLFPSNKTGVQPNSDLPDDLLKDFEEARSIVDSSPRGAAALLRLCVQKLCRHLGEKGKNIDDDIGSLVKKGLNPLVQQSLDIVRVIGNEAVHPGTIDLNDDRETALRLFELLNSVADQMISHPKKVTEMYQKLPEQKRKGIEARDAK